MTPTPAFLVTGVHADSMAAATIGLQFDLPDAVVVRHELDVAAGHLVRTVSDLSGVLEREVVPLEHACTSCAVREDVLPTLQRLGSIGRWGAVVAHLPVAADGLSVCRVLGWDADVAPDIRVAGVVAALDGATAVDDLLGDDLLCERGLATTDTDRRGLGEALGGIVEYSDVIALFGETPDEAHELARRLARPGALVTADWPGLTADQLLPGLHDHDAVEAWVGEVHDGPGRDGEGAHTWSLDLTADRPLHPGRLRGAVDAIGGGPFRSRGCFWLASRPGDVCAWDGAGGQLSVGVNGSWGRSSPFTRLLVTGLRADDVREDLRAAFADAVLTDAELEARGPFWDIAEDGLEPWLGVIRQVA
ncbi:MAG: GTP-binding protein [Dermatophilaceae bacterium]